jgi:hypothetical protein
MKHIRKFNESVNITDEIKDFCNDNLAYLIDEKFTIKCSVGFVQRDYYTSVGIHKEINGNYSRFSWYDVRDDVIPFMSILSKQYIVSGIRFKHKVTTDEGSYIANKHIRVSDIVDDKIEDIEIIGIVFNVTNK